MKNPFDNPEFARNVWLEMSPQRIAAMPAILALVYFVAWLGDPRTAVQDVRLAAVATFVLLTTVWGARLAAASVSDEIVAGTWDSQRMNALSAWQLTLGKLFGGPVFAWYGGLCSLGVFVLTARGDESPARIAAYVLVLISCALATQSAALMSVLLSQSRWASVTARRRRNALIVVVVALFAMQWASGALGWLFFGRPAVVVWYGMAIDFWSFVTAAIVAAAAWGVLGCYRLMRRELQYHDAPVAWAAFLLFVVGYAAGSLHDGTDAGLRFPGVQGALTPALMHLGLALTILLTATYLTMIIERKEWVRWRRLPQALRERDYLGFLRKAPLWLVTLAMTLAVAVALAVCAILSLQPGDALSVVAGTSALLLFFVRDAGLVAWLNLMPDRRRADAAALLYLGVLYLLAPALLALAQLPLLLGLFLPLVSFAQPAWVIAAVLWAAFMVDRVRERLHRLA